MRPQPVDAAALGLVAQWLTCPENSQWLDFGNGHQALNPVTLKFMLQRETNLIRLITPDAGETPLGLVALSNIDRRFRTAMLWYVLGDKGYSSRGYTKRAASLILT